MVYGGSNGHVTDDVILPSTTYIEE